MNLGTPHFRVPGEGRWVEFNLGVGNIGSLPHWALGSFEGLVQLFPSLSLPDRWAPHKSLCPRPLHGRKRGRQTSCGPESYPKAEGQRRAPHLPPSRVLLLI